MPQFNSIEFASVSLFLLTALLLGYASYRFPTASKRWAASLSLVTIVGALHLMMASYRGDQDGWWQFDRPGPLKRKVLKDRGYFEFEDEEVSVGQGGRDGGGGASGSSTGAGADGQGGSLLARAFGSAAFASSRPLRPGDSITDCEDCPEFVIVQPGYFKMGALRGDADALDSEKPYATVVVKKAYAIGRTEVTVGQYAAFVKETGHARPTCGFTDTVRDARLPIDCITWRDAVAYTRWLSAKTMKSFRLPTEAEWTYAARGGASTRYALGDDIPNGDAHIEQRRAKRLPVGSYPANGYGLRDVHGSVAEMVADCWADTLRSTPSDASRANRRGDCTLRVLKDAHAGEPETMSRLSARRPIPLDGARMGVGFRVTRQL